MWRHIWLCAFIALVAPPVTGAAENPTVSGAYVEARSCDVYTGPCIANGEMGLSGREAIMAWRVDRGQWDGVELGGLSVIAVVNTSTTMGDVQFQPQKGVGVLIVDSAANPRQREALSAMAREKAGSLLSEVTAIHDSPIEFTAGVCKADGCATVEAPELVRIDTRCLNDGDHVCGNEETFYPPLTDVKSAQPAFTATASFQGEGLDRRWDHKNRRSAFIASFER